MRNGGGGSIEVWESDYNQLYAQIMDDNSELYEFSPEILILYMCSEKLLDEYYKLENQERTEFPEKIILRISSFWDQLSKVKGLKIVQYNFVEINDGIFGNYANKVDVSFLYNLKKIQALYLEKCQNYKNVYTLDLSSIQMQRGRNVFFDQKLYYLAKMPLSMEILPVVAEQTISVLGAIKGKFKKCVICDLDNTLWGGILAEDGIEGINIGELGIGRAFSDIQYWLKELKNRGIILAVCSKNDEGIAKEAFEKNPEMILALDDFAVFVANWEDKATNIRYIQSKLNIGFDSIVFLDDNSFERNLVRNMLPEVTVPELPEDPALYLSYIKQLNLFETVTFSAEDVVRTKQYQDEIKRAESVKEFSSYEEYLESLNMTAEAKEFDKFQIPRIAQLTQRSNQFNLRTVRYTEMEIEQIALDQNYITCYFTLSDKFGSHGLISVIILKKLDQKQLFVDTWIMSCRVLKRGVEEFVVNKIVELAKKNGYEIVLGEYVPTAKNAMVKDIYLRMGFTEYRDTAFKLNVADYEVKKTEIKEQM